MATHPNFKRCEKCGNCYKIPRGFSVEQCVIRDCPCHKKEEPKVNEFWECGCPQDGYKEAKKEIEFLKEFMGADAKSGMEKN